MFKISIPSITQSKTCCVFIFRKIHLKTYRKPWAQYEWRTVYAKCKYAYDVRTHIWFRNAKRIRWKYLHNLCDYSSIFEKKTHPNRKVALRKVKRTVNVQRIIATQKKMNENAHYCTRCIRTMHEPDNNNNQYYWCVVIGAKTISIIYVSLWDDIFFRMFVLIYII